MGETIYKQYLGIEKRMLFFIFITFFSSEIVIGNSYHINTISVTNVNTIDQLRKVLSKSKYGDSIFIKSNVQFDMTKESPLIIPSGITLYSKRDSLTKGALFYSNFFGTNPIFKCEGNDIVIKNIRIKGPDGKIRQKKMLEKKVKQAERENKTKREKQLIYVYGIPNSSGIKSFGKNLTIDNCEIYNWSHTGIYITKKSTTTIINCNIHHNQRYGLGYGILVQGKAKIKNNIFDYNRHAIASSGKPEASYEAYENICLSNSTLQSHIFDVHGGKDRKDGTDIAGDKFSIHDNIFFVNRPDEVFMIRGVPIKEAKVYNNKILVREGSDIIDYVVQINGKGNLTKFNNQVIVVKDF